MPYLDSPNYELPFASGSDTSRDSAVKAQKFVGRQGIEVLAWVVQRGAFGGTQKEAARELEIERASVCARVNALEKVGKLRKTTERREGCVVYVRAGL